MVICPKNVDFCVKIGFFVKILDFCRFLASNNWFLGSGAKTRRTIFYFFALGPTKDVSSRFLSNFGVFLGFLVCVSAVFRSNFSKNRWKMAVVKMSKFL